MLAAVVVSSLFHLAVLEVDTGWFKRDNVVPPAPRSVTVTMSYRQPEKKEPPQKPVKKKVRTEKKLNPKSDIIPQKKPLSPEVPEPPEKEKTEDLPEDVREETPEAPESLTHGDSLSNMQVVRDAVPLYKTNTPPRYPLAARRRGYQGTVSLMVLVTAEGRVANVWVYESSGYQLLDNAALSAVKNWAFEPGTKNGKSDEMWVKVPVRFELN